MNFLNFLVSFNFPTSTTIRILLPLALILVISKLLTMGAKKIGIPQVIGMLFAGVLLGAITLIPGQRTTDNGSFTIFSSDSFAGLQILGQIGAIFIMFNAGLTTDIKQVKATGLSALIITSLGVIVPLLLGFAVGYILPAEEDTIHTIFRNLFFGVILTATSVSVTVAALRELGRLNSKIGTAIVSAAILDDIIGIIILSVITSLDATLVGGSSSNNLGSEIAWLIGKMVFFFAVAIGVGLLVRKLFVSLSKHYDHHRRIPIFAIVFCFLYSFFAEWLGLAAITGAFFAGLMISGIKDSTDYISRRTDILGYIMFTPVFFANVGINAMSYFIPSEGTPSFDLNYVLFGLAFVVAGLLGKLVGCFVGAKISRYNTKDSYRCGLGMMCRAEVCLISAAKGVEAGIIDGRIYPFLLILILVSSFITPILLKQSYKNEIYNDMHDYHGSEVNQGPSLDQ